MTDPFPCLDSLLALVFVRRGTPGYRQLLRKLRIALDEESARLHREEPEHGSHGQPNAPGARVVLANCFGSEGDVADPVFALCVLASGTIANLRSENAATLAALDAQGEGEIVLDPTLTPAERVANLIADRDRLARLWAAARRENAELRGKLAAADQENSLLHGELTR
jgi:hypothetical protein